MAACVPNNVEPLLPKVAPDAEVCCHPSSPSHSTGTWPQRLGREQRHWEREPQRRTRPRLLPSWKRCRLNGSDLSSAEAKQRTQEAGTLGRGAEVASRVPARGEWGWVRGGPRTRRQQSVRARPTPPPPGGWPRTHGLRMRGTAWPWALGA